MTPDAPSPSPYAPGIIADEKLPPRPAGRPAVFLAAAFIIAIVSSEWLSGLWLESGDLDVAIERGKLTLLNMVGFVPGLLILLWAYLTDAVPVWGTRREGYLLLTGLMMALVWLVLVFTSNHFAVWVVAAVQLNLGASVSRAAIVGALAEIGRRRAATGRLTAGYIGLNQLAALVAPLLVVFISSMLISMSTVLENILPIPTAYVTTFAAGAAVAGAIAVSLLHGTIVEPREGRLAGW